MQDMLNISSDYLYFDSTSTLLPKESTLITDTATVGHTSFYTTLQLVTNTGIKALKVKEDPGAQANHIPLNHYRQFSPKKCTKASNTKQGSLQPTHQIWISRSDTRKRDLISVKSRFDLWAVGGSLLQVACLGKLVGEKLSATV